MFREYIREYGIITFVIVGFTRFLEKLSLNNVVELYQNFKYSYIINFLDKYYRKNIDEKLKSNHSKIQDDSPIWIFWWQGEEAMPQIVKSCYKSVLKNAEKHPVILITNKNVREYVDIPEYIYKKIKEKKITLTHFSDILRENLLFKYGGIWMDATIYMTAPFSDEMYKYEYYSIKGAFENWKWTGFFQASGKKNIFPETVSHLFNCYWKEHDCLLTYLLIDCFMELAREHNSDIDRMITDLPSKDTSIFLLNDQLLDREYCQDVMDELCKKTNIHKLSYKYKHEIEINGKTTFYGHLINGND